ncbi:MAG: ABC transporter ATP-binding protein [Actinobacteria bacterium]|jgi:ABC-type multidrug transport system fused ATPase/permease subunit|nr:ABC transporter ATP-binding protein [Actinomycetota bacterium]MBT3747103.1 ABC transporter ATP-binding protein [Actinomycetota bacterium]MBT3969488.1 ABC transporter ATP-binding protein [Actinomycetota bacterium]MBT4010277.1 ABC transporter ATP-binding protein [Actinomycetota bacterium]MBT4302860.1 ABC transporter ATP-binding protein [Actinomycetota bacterium]
MAHILAAMGANVFAVAVVGFTIVIGRVTDEVILPGLSGEGPAVSGRTVLSGMAALGIVGLVRGLSIMVRRWFNMMAVARTQRTWRQSLTDRYLDAPMSFHWERPAGQLLAHADADVEVATSMLMPLAFSVSVVALIVVSLISLLVVHPLFALVALVLFPTLAVLNRRFTKSIEAPAARAQAEVGRVSSIAHESLDGVLVVKTLGRQDQEVARFAEAAAALREERIAVGRLRANYSPVIYSLPNLGILALLLVGTWLFSQGAVTLGEMVRAMALFSILSLPMEILGFLFQMIPQSVVAQDRINKVLAVDPESTVVGGEVGSAIVDFVGLSFAYPTDGPQAPLVLENLSLHIDPGETVALVGSTGAGKSTLVALLAALMPPTEGQVLLGGVDVQDLGSEGTAAVVAPVFQETFLFADSVRQNLTLGRDIPEGELQRVLALVEAERFVSEMPQGIDTVVGERGVTLSGGQRQRLAIARGLLRRPKVLVLDDATSAVDPTIEAAILANLRAHGGRTLLVVAHRLATIRLADRVLFLEGGRIAAQGTHEELLAVPAYAALAQAYEKAGS